MARGFLGGFNVGFNAVDAVLRDKRDIEDRDRRNKREDERWAVEKERMDRERNLERELSEAGQAPTQGKAVGGNFATSEADQRFLAEQDAAIAELEGRAPSATRLAAGAGNQVVDRSDPRAQNTRAGYLARVSDVQRRHGKVSESITTEELSRQIQKSGVKDALDHLLAGGTAAQAQAMLKEAGRIDGELIAAPTVRKGPNDVQMPDFMLSVRDADGNVRQLGSALEMRFMADNPAEYLKVLNQEGKARADSELSAANLALDERRVGVAERQAATMERYRRDQIENARAAREAQSGPQFDRLSTSDEKALREILSANLPEGSDLNVTADVAARMMAANPNISLSEAALLAATPGVEIRNVQTQFGPGQALVIPGPPDAQGNPTQGRAVVLAPGARFFDTPAGPPPAPQPPSALQRIVDRFTGEKTAEKAGEKPARQAPSAPEIASGMSPQTEALGARLDAAREASRAARDRLNSYGTRQQRADPQGFAAAKQAAEQASRAVQAAQAEYEAAVNKELPPVRR